MPYLCRIGLHKPLASEVWNGGYFFSRCSRCDQDMIRRPEGEWRTVPPGHHVVWRPVRDRKVAYVVPKTEGRETLPNLLSRVGPTRLE
jgi:hypothetical protein